MKKVIYLFVFATLVIGMTACGGGDSNSNENEVTMWVHMSGEEPEGEALKESVDQFNEDNEGGYKAEIEFVPRSDAGGGYEDKINAALTTDTLPDVLTLDGPNTAAYAESGIIASIDDEISNIDDFLPSVIEQGTYEDELYAIGYTESAVGIFYNKEMLEDAGVDLSELPTVDEPWDWNQFMELSEKLVNTYDKPAVDMSLDDRSEWLMYAFSPLLWSQGGDILSEDQEEATGVFNDENAVKTMTFIQDMVKEGYTTISPVDKGFHTGEYPMHFGGSWTMQELEEYPDVDYGVMPYPTSPDTNELVSPSGTWQYAMSGTTEKEDAASALIDFMTETEQLKKVTLANTVLPATYEVKEEIEDEVSPEMSILIEQNTETAQPRPVLVEYPQISRIFRETISDVTQYEENEDIQKLLDEKASEMDKELK